jgi:hypothetical protein
MKPKVPIDTVFMKMMSKTTIVIFVVIDIVFIRLMSNCRLLLKSPVSLLSTGRFGSSKSPFL